MSEVTHILSAIEQGDSHAAEQLLPLVYDELRTLAATRWPEKNRGKPPKATAMAQEAYWRSGAGNKAQHWNSGGLFLAAAAGARRRFLVDTARRKQSSKHGGGRQRLELDDFVG